MKKVILFAAVIALVFTGCSKDENVGSNNDNNAIGFRVVGKKGQTYATSTEPMNFNNFFVWGVWDKDGTGTTLDGTFLQKQFVEKNAGVWSYSPTKYWPTAGTIEFYAYSPVSSVNAEYDGSTVAAPVINYTNPATFKLQEDFVVATATGDKTSGTNVALTFDHVLSQVEFQARGLHADLIYQIQKIEILEVNTVGTYDLVAGEWDASAFATPASYEALPETSPSSVLYDATAAAPFVYTIVTGDANYTSLHLMSGSWAAPAGTTIVIDPALLETGKSYIALTFSVKDKSGYEYNTNSDNGTVYIPFDPQVGGASADNTTKNTRFIYQIDLGTDLDELTFTATLEAIDEEVQDPIDNLPL